MIDPLVKAMQQNVDSNLAFLNAHILAMFLEALNALFYFLQHVPRPLCIRVLVLFHKHAILQARLYHSNAASVEL